jgi:hypothetical protein
MKQQMKKNHQLHTNNKGLLEEEFENGLSDEDLETHNQQVDRHESSNRPTESKRLRLTSNGENSKYLDDWVDEGESHHTRKMDPHKSSLDAKRERDRDREESDEMDDIINANRQEDGEDRDKNR